MFTVQNTDIILAFCGVGDWFFDVNICDRLSACPPKQHPDCRDELCHVELHLPADEGSWRPRASSDIKFRAATRNGDLIKLRRIISRDDRLYSTRKVVRIA